MYSYKYWIIINLLFSWIFLSTANKKESRKSQLDECKLCKLLTKSFNHWMVKTSRNKYDGGDAAWEESKLKSYSKSEVRLVEIQEGMCSELKKHQDHCYTLNAQVEQHIEQWWSDDDLRETDFYSWLCITTLQHCCPESHYGKNCDSCEHIRYGKMCSGYGRCDGDGTRKGNGSCICNKGYEGVVCEDCSEYYFRNSNGFCDACYLSCEKCLGTKQTDCTSCKFGWAFKSNGECIDIDECADTTVCNSDEYCTNTVGSYECSQNCYEACKTCSGPLPQECTSCNAERGLIGGWCLDKKEIETLKKNSSQSIGLYLLYIVTLKFIESNFAKYLGVSILSLYVYNIEIGVPLSSFHVLYYYYYAS